MDEELSGLPADIATLIDGGVIDTATARAAGVPRDRLHQLAKAGLLTRLARGSYALASATSGFGEWDLFRLKSRAFAMANRPDAYLTGWAGAISWELPTLGRPPAVPTALRPKVEGRHPSSSGRGRIVVAELPEDHRCQIGDLLIVSRAWAAVDVARIAPLPHSLVVADHAVRQGANLADPLEHMSRWEGIGRSRWVAGQANPAVESPLETLGRFTFIEYDFPMPVINAWVGRDRPERRVDGLLPWHWFAYEADGALKYDNRGDASVIVREQQEREFYLRRLGLDFGRFGWPDVFPSRRPWADRVQALLDDHAPQAEPVRWWKHVPGRGPFEPTAEDWPSPNSVGLLLPPGWAHHLNELRRTVR
jgi:hypothetical protein